MILVTGVAGFIGMQIALKLLQNGHTVVGIDNLNNYYDVNLKKARLKELVQFSGFSFDQVDISDRKSLEKIFLLAKPDKVIHLAAQAGVRYSLVNPEVYIQANLVGFFNILEICRSLKPDHLIYASSSSIYGNSTELPLSVNQKTDKPVSLYAATKKSNELLSYSYSHLFSIPTTGLRFFTVYGPWGRPDMAVWKFTDAILTGRPIDLYNNGNLSRDLTYVDDIVNAIYALLNKIPLTHDDQPPHQIFNIGNNNPTNLLCFVEILEELLGVKAKKNFLPMQLGDVFSTYADVADLKALINYEAKTDLKDGLTKWVAWYRNYISLI